MPIHAVKQHHAPARGQLPNFDFPGMNDGARDGGGDRNRTDDLMLAKHAISQLSYAPFRQGFGGQPPFDTRSDEGWTATRSAQSEAWRSEEHTTELPSLMCNSNDVFRLKKKHIKHNLT